MKVGLDTNFLCYADGLDDDLRRNRANKLLLCMPAVEIMIPLQVIAEFYRVMVRKRIVPDEDVEKHVFVWADFYSTIEANYNVISDACDLRRKHKLQVFDAIILSACALAGCSILLSEDMQHGFQWRGCTVVNPFRDPIHPLLSALLKDTYFG